MPPTSLAGTPRPRVSAQRVTPLAYNCAINSNMHTPKKRPSLSGILCLLAILNPAREGASLAKKTTPAFSSDGGELLLGKVEAGMHIVERLTRQFVDHSDPEAIEHTLKDLVGQRVYALALGYEDHNDNDRLRLDPLLAPLTRHSPKCQNLKLCTTQPSAVISFLELRSVRKLRYRRRQILSPLANPPDRFQKDSSIMRHILVLFAHPSLDRSEVNRPLALATAGVDLAVREMFDGSLTLGTEVLRTPGMHPFKIEKMARAFRRHDQAGLEQLYDLWDENPDIAQNRAYLARAKEHSQTLKGMMEADRLQLHDRTERGWTPPPKGYTRELES